MLYFVQTFNTYSPKNRACKKLIDFVQKFERVLVKDEVSLDALKEEIRGQRISPVGKLSFKRIA